MSQIRLNNNFSTACTLHSDCLIIWVEDVVQGIKKDELSKHWIVLAGETNSSEI